MRAQFVSLKCRVQISSTMIVYCYYPNLSSRPYIPLVQSLACLQRVVAKELFVVSIFNYHNHAIENKIRNISPIIVSQK